jgi:hypothetical protein
LIRFDDFIAQHNLPRNIESLRAWVKTWELCYETGELIELHYWHRGNPALPLATQPEPNKQQP